MTLTIVPKDAEKLLTWPGLLEAFEAGHRLPKPDIKDLFVYRGPDTVLDRATWIDGLGALVKVATVIPSNAQRGLPTVNGSVTLYDDSLLSARRLARKDAKNFLLVGAGTVAKSMVQAYSSLFPDARFTVWSRSRSSAEALGLPVADNLEAAVKAADVICTATMATEPLIRGDWLQPGQHLDLIGAYKPGMREVDDTAMARARLFVDARTTTVHHIGELIDPLKSGAITESHIIADFYDDPALYVRRSDDEITIAKNGGGAHLDLMTASYIAAMWSQR
jgi:ornithine cyclodeaminase